MSTRNNRIEETRRSVKLKSLRRNALRKRLASLVAASSLGIVPQFSLAHESGLPTGANVVAGRVTLNSSGTGLNVNSTTPRSIVNWNSFNIGGGKVANFNLPNANSAILNRVTAQNMPSAIDGALNSNGHVYLVNPSGIVVGAQGTVNTNGFVASTFDVANDAFMNGGPLAIRGSASNAAIVNNGKIKTGSGGAHLIANQIANHGVIESQGGNITMSGGGTVTLDNGVTYVQASMKTLTSGISPTAGLIQNSGTIRATGAATAGGEVYLVNPNGTILHDGTIAAQDVHASGATIGGKVQLEADDIALTGDSTIDASGTHGGGEVLVGGQWQGGAVAEATASEDRPTMTQATTVSMEAASSIDASGIESGDGGSIVLWTDVTKKDSFTKVFGRLVARAGEVFGTGGKIETSGYRVDTTGINVDAGATNGDGGQWLIDPFNYLIDAVAAGNIVSALNSGTSVTVTTTGDNASYGSSGNSSDLGDITVASDIVTGAMSGDATLTLQAHRHIKVSANVDATQNANTAKLNVALLADSDHSGDGIGIVSTDYIKTNGGDLTFGDGSTANIGGVNVKVGGDVYINGTSAQSLETGGGMITVNGETIVANSSGVTFDTDGGDIVFGGVLNSGNQYDYVDGPDGQANSWDWARSDAKNGTAGGAALGDSYMVTITSRLENAIAGIAADYRGAWIGAYRDVATPDDWKWADGPEGGQHFFTQAGAGGSAEAGWYSNFGAAEPNGSGVSGETRGQFFGNQGQWNDLHPTVTFAGTQGSTYDVLGYVRETNLSPTAVTIDAGAGSVTFDGGVGGGKTLASLNVTSGAATVNGDALITTGAQNFSSALDVTSLVGLKVDGTTLTTGGVVDFVAADNVDVDASIVVPGAISIEGNEVVVDGNLVSSATGDIYLQSNSQTSNALVLNGDINKTGGDRSMLTLRSDGRATLNNVNTTGTTLDVVVWSDYQNANAGGASIEGTVSTNGGHVWLGGSSTVGGSDSWNGLAVGDGPSVGGSVANWNALDLNGDINTTGGDVLLWAGDGYSTGIDGIGMTANQAIRSGAGDVTVIANDTAGAVLAIDSTGRFTFQPHDNAWTTVGAQFDFVGTIGSDTFTGSGDAGWLQIDNYSSLGGLTIGKEGITSGIYVYNPIVIDGNVNLVGGYLVVDDAIDTSGASGEVLLKASGDIELSGSADIITNGGDVTLWSDSDDNGAGWIKLGSGTSIVSSGGDIVLGGGLDLDVDGNPDGDAIGAANLVASGTFNSGVSLHESTLDSRVGGILDAASGDITVNGTSTYTGLDRAVGTLLYSSKLYGNVVDVTGSVTHTGGTTTRYGISSNGDMAPNNTNIQAYGGITLTGNAATPADQYAIRWGTNHEMSTVDGDISINSDGQLLYLSSQTLTLADTRSLIFDSDYDAEWRNVIAGDGGLTKRGTGELVLTRQNTYTGPTDIDSGDLIIRHDAPSITTRQFNGPGTLTIESDAAGFSSTLSVAAAINGVSSLTIGKSANTAGVTLQASVSTTGPIDIYGGTLSIDGTVAAGSGNITLVGNDLLLAASLASTGVLSIETQTAGTSIGVGTGSGDLHVSVPELGFMQDGFSSITIGDSGAGDLQVGGLNSLGEDLVLRAGIGNTLIVSGPVSWSGDNALTLSAGQDIQVNADIDVGGSAATLNLFYGGTDGSASPTANANFNIDLTGQYTIDFSDTSANLKIGNEAYTLIDSVSDFAGMTASGRYALANGLDLSSATYGDAVYTTTFTGKFDGLGHAVDGMTISDTDGGNLGLFAQLNGATVRHLGVMNFNFRTNSSVDGVSGSEYRIGGLVGNIGGAGTPVSIVTTLDGVWSSGVISTEHDSKQKFFFGGGLVGSQNGGFLDMTRSFSSANVSTQGSYTDNLATGGLVGDIGINTNLPAGIHTQTNSSVIDYSISKSYATGSIIQ